MLPRFERYDSAWSMYGDEEDDETALDGGGPPTFVVGVGGLLGALPFDILYTSSAALRRIHATFSLPFTRQRAPALLNSTALRNSTIDALPEELAMMSKQKRLYVNF